MTSPDLARAKAERDRLYEKLELAMEGRGRTPDPEVIRAAEIAVRAAEIKLEREGVKA